MLQVTLTSVETGCLQFFYSSFKSRMGCILSKEEQFQFDSKVQRVRKDYCKFLGGEGGGGTVSV